MNLEILIQAARQTLRSFIAFSAFPTFFELVNIRAEFSTFLNDIQPSIHHLLLIIVLALMYQHRVAYLMALLAAASAPASVLTAPISSPQLTRKPTEL